MNSGKPKKGKLIVLGGPTGVGKTEVSIKLARHLGCPIVSADSRQFYKEMEIGTAKPSSSQRAEVTHYFVDFLSVEEHYSAGDYEKDVIPFLEGLFEHFDKVILTGGSGLFIEAVCSGLDQFPEISNDVNDRVESLLEREGLQYLQEELKIKDPTYYREVDLNNPRRLVRALKVIYQSGQPYSSFRSKEKKERSFEIFKSAIYLERSELYKAINARCDKMLERGLLQEVRSLYDKKHHRALQTIGYREFFPYLQGKVSWEKAVSNFKKASRQYAKRQLTWFRKYSDVHWFQPEKAQHLISLIEKS